MKATESKVSCVPTNIITGFLGVGKTTLILNLLKNKPSNERWAVLVNEFGEVGVDGNLIEGNHPEGVFVREVPGGCMCCAAGLPMLVALNQLLTKANPHRLLIEPTGLGHPKEVVETLSAQHYQTILNLQTCITLVDARRVSDTRYIENDIFNQQISIADVVIGHKADLYDIKCRRNLISYVSAKFSEKIPVTFASNGEVKASILDGKSRMTSAQKHPHKHINSASKISDVNERVIPERGFICTKNSSDGYSSVGWRIASNIIFSRKAIHIWLRELKVERAKGVFLTMDGVFAYNLTPDSFTEYELDDCIESRLEIIAQSEFDIDETSFLICIDQKYGTSTLTR